MYMEIHVHSTYMYMYIHTQLILHVAISCMYMYTLYIVCDEEDPLSGLVSMTIKLDTSQGKLLGLMTS